MPDDGNRASSLGFTLTVFFLDLPAEESALLPCKDCNQSFIARRRAPGEVVFLQELNFANVVCDTCDSTRACAWS